MAIYNGQKCLKLKLSLQLNLSYTPLLNNINYDQLATKIKSLTCFDDINIENIAVIPQGLSHISFKVTTTGFNDDYFVKYFDANDESFNKELLLAKAFANNVIEKGTIEQSTLAISQTNKQDHSQCFTPRLIASEDDYIVYQFIAGQSLLQSSYSENDKASICIQLMTKLHQCRADLPVLNMQVVIANLMTPLRKTSVFNEQQHDVINTFYQQFIQGFSVKGHYLCHGDLNFSNVICSSPVNVTTINYHLIDFECAFLADREFDLAMLIAINDLPLDSVSVLIKKYHQHSQGKVSLSRYLVTCYLVFSYLINGLWYLGQKDLLPPGLGQQLAQQQLSRLSRLTHFDFLSIFSLNN
jgi:thiamine kinase-like enzyme